MFPLRRERLPANAACSDDGNLCTLDVCQNTVCSHPPKGDGVSCLNDGNVCTTGQCKSGACQQVFNTNVCNDGNACTSNDICSNGTCQGSSFVNCDDGNPCTEDSCNKVGKCQHLAVSGVSCQADSSACPMGTCQAGTCMSTTGVVCQAKYKADLCASVSVPGLCSASGQCVASSVPPGYSCPGCNGICLKCLIFQFCIDLF